LTESPVPIRNQQETVERCKLSATADTPAASKAAAQISVQSLAIADPSVAAEASLSSEQTVVAETQRSERLAEQADSGSSVRFPDAEEAVRSTERYTASNWNGRQDSAYHISCNTFNYL